MLSLTWFEINNTRMVFSTSRDDRRTVDGSVVQSVYVLHGHYNKQLTSFPLILLVGRVVVVFTPSKTLLLLLIKPEGSRTDAAALVSIDDDVPEGKLTTDA